MIGQEILLWEYSSLFGDLTAVNQTIGCVSWNPKMR